MHLFSDKHVLFVTSKTSEEISAGNYLQIYRGSQTLSVSLDPWEEQLSLDNLVETLDDLYVHVSTVCVFICV